MMKHKSNPWVALIALILTVVLIVCICTGCADATEAADTIEKAEATEAAGTRFVFESASSTHSRTYIITDTETGVRYLYIANGYGGGLTRLEEAPGEEADR